MSDKNHMSPFGVCRGYTWPESGESAPSASAPTTVSAGVDRPYQTETPADTRRWKSRKFRSGYDAADPLVREIVVNGALDRVADLAVFASRSITYVADRGFEVARRLRTRQEATCAYNQEACAELGAGATCQCAVVKQVEVTVSASQPDQLPEPPSN